MSEAQAKNKILCSFRFDEDLAKLLKEKAQVAGVSQSRIIEDALKEYLAVPLSTRIAAREASAASRGSAPAPNAPLPTDPAARQQELARLTHELAGQATARLKQTVPVALVPKRKRGAK